MTSLKKWVIGAWVLIALSANTAWAISLDEAKSQGVIGETPSGYIATVSSNPSKEVVKLVADINQKRKAAYAESAEKAGVDIKVIEARIAQKLYERADKGEYLQTPSGQWYQKK